MNKESMKTLKCPTCKTQFCYENMLFCPKCQMPIYYLTDYETEKLR